MVSSKAAKARIQANAKMNKRKKGRYDERVQSLYSNKAYSNKAKRI
jgi:hypothetical protein